MWLLRVGYYKLMRVKEIAGDWIWIVDHTIQSGNMKCLLIIGVRYSYLESKDRDKKLTYSDMEPIALYPVEQSNGNIVFKQLEEATRKTGPPRQIIADHGSDLKSGINKFLDKHPTTAYVFDVKHFTALLLEKEYKDELMWISFRKHASDARNALHQTSLSYLEPPNQRTKSRYMNMDILVSWGIDFLTFFDNMMTSKTPIPESATIKKKLGWIVDFRQDLDEWVQVMEIVGKAESFVRTHGLYQGADKKLRPLLKLDFDRRTERLIRIRWSLIEYVLNESDKAKEGECLLGSSELIESVFGKFKSMQHEQVKGGLTGFVLSMAAGLAETTEDVVRKALESTPVKVVRKWVQDSFGKTVRTKRQEAFFKPPKAEQKHDQLALTA